VNKTASTTINPSVTALKGIAVSPSPIVGGHGATGTISLSGPASTNGAVIMLTSSDSSKVIVPGTITVPQGATSVAFQANTKWVSVPTVVTLTASYSGVSVTTTLTVVPRHRSSVTVPASQYAAVNYERASGPPAGGGSTREKEGSSWNGASSNWACQKRLEVMGNGCSNLNLASATDRVKKGWILL
jgi:hypothetical protein